MTRIPLIGGSYQARSIIADAQRCVNLYPEKNPQGSQSPFTYYPTPGLTLLRPGPLAKPVRCLYRATNDELFTVIGTNVYYVDSSFALTLLGTIADADTPVSMVDNGTTIMLVDGSADGYTIVLSSHAFAAIADPDFLGGTTVQYADGFFILNEPNSRNFYISDSNAITFDPLYIAAKAGFADPIQTLAVIHREIWLLGVSKTEIWYNSGAADFPYQILPGVYIEHGCAAPYSVATYDVSVLWLSQDLQGNVMVLEGTPYKARRISTYALENALQQYSVVSDATGYIYQQGGHVFYLLNFPTESKTWCYDMSSELWHERSYRLSSGAESRHRGNCAAYAYGKSVVGDYSNGNIYELDTNAYTDNGQALVRIRTFPHLMADNLRVVYNNFEADMECGTIAGVTQGNAPQVSLRWSDDRGKSYGNPVLQSLGATGQYRTVPTWNRLGMARDRVFELSWDANTKTALQGAFINVTPLRS